MSLCSSQQLSTQVRLLLENFRIAGMRCRAVVGRFSTKHSKEIFIQHMLHDLVSCPPLGPEGEKAMVSRGGVGKKRKDY
jgi:hypothetical protein